MLVDVGRDSTNLLLNACLYGLVSLTILSLIPWPLRGRRNRWTLFLPLAALALCLTYEIAIPVQYDIRLDLLLIVRWLYSSE